MHKLQGPQPQRIFASIQALVPVHGWHDFCGLTLSQVDGDSFPSASTEYSDLWRCMLCFFGSKAFSWPPRLHPYQSVLYTVQQFSLQVSCAFAARKCFSPERLSGPLTGCLAQARSLLYAAAQGALLQVASPKYVAVLSTLFAEQLAILTGMLAV